MGALPRRLLHDLGLPAVGADSPSRRSHGQHGRGGDRTGVRLTEPSSGAREAPPLCSSSWDEGGQLEPGREWRRNFSRPGGRDGGQDIGSGGRGAGCVLGALRAADHDRPAVPPRGAGDRARAAPGARRTVTGSAQDAARNLVFDVPATDGRESAPTVVLQGHLDMVCERQPDSPNDPAEGRIELVSRRRLADRERDDARRRRRRRDRRDDGARRRRLAAARAAPAADDGRRGGRPRGRERARRRR